MIELERILFPTDFSDFSKYAASFAVSFACDYGAKLYILHVAETLHDVSETFLAKFSTEEFRDRVEEMAAEELESASTPDMLDRLDYEVALAKGKPSNEIVTFAKTRDIDLIVMGTHGRTAVEAALMGSTAEKVVRKASCPVLTVRMPGYRFVMPSIG